MQQMSFPWARPRRVILFCVVFSTLICMGLALLSMQFIQKLSVWDERIFLGSLAQEHQHVTVFLPKGAILKAIEVKDDDSVVEGQTLASFDVPELEQNVARLQEQILGFQLERSCVFDPHYDAPLDIANVSSETKVELRFALERCKTFHAEDVITFSELSKVLKALKSEHDIIMGSMARSGGAGSNSPRHAENLLRSLLAKRELSAKIAAAEHDLLVFQKAMEERRLARAVDVNLEIQSLEAELKRVEAFLKNPRILSPTMGRVLRVRSILPKTTVSYDTEVVQITPSETPPYILSIYIPFEAAKSILPNTIVAFSVQGFDGRESLDLKAQWPSAGLYGAVGADLIKVDLDILPDSQDELAMRSDSLMRWQGGAASQVRLRFAPRPLSAVLKDLLFKIFPSNKYTL